MWGATFRGLPQNYRAKLGAKMHPAKIAGCTLFEQRNLAYNIPQRFTVKQREIKHVINAFALCNGIVVSDVDTLVVVRVDTTIFAVVRKADVIRHVKDALP